MAAIHGLGSGTSAVREVPSLTIAIEQFDPLLQRLGAVGGDLEVILTRLLGDHPRPVESNRADAPSPQHVLALINVRARALADLVEAIEEVTKRIGSVL